MDIKYKHIPVRIDFDNPEDGIKDFLKELGVKWKRENITVEVKIFILKYSLVQQNGIYNEIIISGRIDQG